MSGHVVTATGNTSVCGWRFEPAGCITGHVVKHFASALLANLEAILPRYW